MEGRQDLGAARCATSRVRFRVLLAALFLHLKQLQGLDCFFMRAPATCAVVRAHNLHAPRDIDRQAFRYLRPRRISRSLLSL
jgi:hypothetical protein